MNMPLSLFFLNAEIDGALAKAAIEDIKKHEREVRKLLQAAKRKRERDEHVERSKADAIRRAEETKGETARLAEAKRIEDERLEQEKKRLNKISAYWNEIVTLRATEHFKGDRISAHRLLSPDRTLTFYRHEARHLVRLVNDCRLPIWEPVGATREEICAPYEGEV